MGNPKTFSFTLKNDISELKILCRQLESIGGALGLPQRFVFEINLALDELFTNIISYGFNSWVTRKHSRSRSRTTSPS